MHTGSQPNPISCYLYNHRHFFSWSHSLGHNTNTWFFFFIIWSYFQIVALTVLSDCTGTFGPCCYTATGPGACDACPCDSPWHLKALENPAPRACDEALSKLLSGESCAVHWRRACSHCLLEEIGRRLQETPVRKGCSQQSKINPNLVHQRVFSSIYVPAL